MRHGQKGYKLGRTHAHRAATLAALSSALIEHKRIRTTHTKAKALRQFVEPLITRSKTDTTHNRRQVFRHLRDKHAVTELFTAVAAEVGDRPGGYTRIIKLGQRGGDGAEMAIIELVDYNDVKPEGGSSGRSRTRRGGGRGRRKKKNQNTTSAETATTTQTQTEDQIVDENDQMEGVQTETVEAPVAEEQTVPVPERTGDDDVDLAALAADAEESGDDEDADDEEKQEG